MDIADEIKRQLKIKEWVEYMKWLESERLRAAKAIRELNNGR